MVQKGKEAPWRGVVSKSDEPRVVRPAKKKKGLEGGAKTRPVGGEEAEKKKVLERGTCRIRENRGKSWKRSEARKGIVGDGGEEGRAWGSGGGGKLFH